MNTFILCAFGWIVPGGAHLLMRRYLQFAVFAAVVWISFGAGIALDGGMTWPDSADLAGLDTAATLVFRAGAAAKAFAGAPFLAARLWVGEVPFADSRLHEYGTTLLTMAGLFNLLAISSALDVRKERSE